MSTDRALMLALSAFAVSLGALSVGAGTAWIRCGDESGCTGDLALGVAAAAPAALLASVVTLLLRRRASSVLASRVLLAGAVGLAAVPLAVFVIRDLATLAAMAALGAALVYLTLADDIAADAATSAHREEQSQRNAGIANDWAARDRGGARDAETDKRDATSAATSVGADEHLRPPGPLVVSLSILGLRDFEQLAAIYEALSAHPDTTSVVVRRFVRTFSSLEIGITSAASWTSIENLLLLPPDAMSQRASSQPPSGRVPHMLAHDGISGRDGQDDSPRNAEPRQLLRWRPRA